jgi:hypothetical protein
MPRHHNKPRHRPKTGESRPRSLQHRLPFVHAVFWSVIHYLCLVASLTAVIAFFIEPTVLATRVIAGCLLLTGLTWLVAMFLRRSAHCPLCKGTPLINSGALTHNRAVRLPPFNEGVTATLSIIASHKFRCMYCGSLFDLLKTPARLRYKSNPAAGPPPDPE